MPTQHHSAGAVPVAPSHRHGALREHPSADAAVLVHVRYEAVNEHRHHILHQLDLQYFAGHRIGGDLPYFAPKPSRCALRHHLIVDQEGVEPACSREDNVKERGSGPILAVWSTAEISKFTR